MDCQRDRAHTVVAAVIVLLACGGGLGCGRKGALRPPEDVAPKTITDLHASTVSGGIRLTWSRPDTYVDNSRMTDLAGFVVERATGASPSATFRRITVMEVSDRDRFRKVKRFHYLDPNTILETAYRYRVVSFTLDRYFSAPSNIVTTERQAADEQRHAPLPTP
ncbi:MAG: hypothetical protein ACE5I7_01710 [Candidatus Binatia bacterium]